MAAFDQIERTDTKPKRRTETCFSYWNRSACPRPSASRALIERWFSHVPSAQQMDLRTRFRNSVALDASPFHELLLHELLYRESCTLLPHPNVSGKQTRPDYLVTQPNGNQFLLEARSSSNLTSGPENSPLLHRVRDLLQTCNLDGFSLGIDKLIAGKNDLAWHKFEKHLKTSIVKTESEPVALPTFRTSDGWRIHLTAIPWSKDKGSSSTIHYEAWSGSAVSLSSTLLRALKKKGGRYGELDMPYVIAVNSCDAMCTDHHCKEALFGSSTHSGFWGTASNPLYRRVSAVLLTVNIWPETLLLGQTYSCLFLGGLSISRNSHEVDLLRVLTA